MWPEDYEAQKSYMQDVRNRISRLQRRTTPLTYYSATPPTFDTFRTVWDEQIGAQYPYEKHAQFLWYDSTKNALGNVWTIPDGSGVFKKMTKTYPQSDMEHLDTQSIDGSGHLSFTAIPQTYKHLYVTFTVRQVTTEGYTIARLNAVSSGYRGKYSYFSELPVANTLGAGMSGLPSDGILCALSLGSTASPSWASTGGHLWVFDYATSGAKSCIAESYSEGVSNGYYFQLHTGLQGPLAVSSLTLMHTAGGALEPGSYAHLFGVR